MDMLTRLKGCPTFVLVSIVFQRILSSCGEYCNEGFGLGEHLRGRPIGFCDPEYYYENVECDYSYCNCPPRLRGEDWCDKFSCNNTMCRYGGRMKDCSGKTYGIDQATMEDILNTHNSYRQCVADGIKTKHGKDPTIANMFELEWDYELETIAQRWADQCQFRHDKDRRSYGFRYSVGQNIAVIPAGCEDHKPQFGCCAIKMWFNEGRQFTIANRYPFVLNEDTANYTQMVWADTYTIGCGYKVCPAPYDCINDCPPQQMKFYVCNYGPGGNIQGAKMYEFGKPCTNCSIDSLCSSKYSSLCNINALECERRHDSDTPD